MNQTPSPPQYQYGCGLTCSVTASVLFGITPWLVQQLYINGNELFWVRMVTGSLYLIIIITMSAQWQDVKQMIRHGRNLLFLIPGTALIGIQWWLFVWAPVNQQTKELALGYFLLPLTLALTGWFFHDEKLNLAQKLAITLAASGIAIELWQHGQLPWVALVVAGLYPVYFMVRQNVKASAASIKFFEVSIFLPFALYFLSQSSEFILCIQSTPSLWLLLPLFGIICASSMLLYVSASKKLPFSLFGLLSYLEPALIFVIAVAVLQEPFEATQCVTYGLIWAATLIVVIDLIRLLLHQINQQKKG
ncbi:EamA family transporter RarD [Endozoicomonas euniceicola]|uniref:EamA family transporter RarD n=1 Tax=Endozoicomonas euniceicola TaxID=1234143 RepID=A0ABY6GXW1_9GAMM|nr:EamA family transporter RarD [Endozoicomonas euniceicola]UYM16789.1 EamA family transporter RarD [Endozoicomonas euniceicola]